MDDPVILPWPYKSGMRVVGEIFCFLNVEYWLVEFMKLEKDAKPFALSCSNMLLSTTQNARFWRSL
jgi:hypothetical protein